MTRDNYYGMNIDDTDILIWKHYEDLLGIRIHFELLVGLRLGLLPPPNPRKPLFPKSISHRPVSVPSQAKIKARSFFLLSTLFLLSPSTCKQFIAFLS